MSIKYLTGQWIQNKKPDLLKFSVFVELNFVTLYSHDQTYKQIFFNRNWKNFGFKFQYTVVSTDSFWFELISEQERSILHKGHQISYFTQSSVFYNPQEVLHWCSNCVLEEQIHGQAIMLSFLVSSISNLCSQTSNHRDYVFWGFFLSLDQPG